MKALINGTSAPLFLAKGSNESAIVTLFNDDGSLLNLTGGSVDLVVYDRSDRANPAVATHAGDTLTTPTAGVATIAIDDSELTYNPGEYYMFAKHTTSTATVFLAGPFTLVVR